MEPGMELDIKYRGRVATTEDVEFINNLIARHPNDSRWTLSRKLCQEWNWVQPNGTLRDMVCRGFMLALHRAGYINLPPKRRSPKNYLANRKKPPVIDVDNTPIVSTVKVSGPFEIRQVRRSDLEPLFKSLIEEYHYLGYCQPFGEHLKFIIFAGSDGHRRFAKKTFISLLTTTAFSFCLG